MFLKILSFDLEVLPLDGQMPDPERCPIMMISCSLNERFDLYDICGIHITTDNFVFLLRNDIDINHYVVSDHENSISSSNDRTVIEFSDETIMVNKFFEFFRLYNPDIVTGYNINGFDIPYIIDRCRVLDIHNIKLGRGDSDLYYRKHISKGLTVYKVDGFTGRILFDVLYMLRREDASNTFLKKYNLKRLTLEHVSHEILGIDKLDFPISRMIDYWNDTGNRELANEFVDYCSRDSLLPLEFIRKFRMVDRFFTLSNKSGKLPQVIINSMGSGILVDNLMIKEYKKRDRVMPCRGSYEKGIGEKKELLGAYVKEPDTGITDNLGSVDYTSLYPTIMIRHNLSYDTVILDDNILDNLNDEDVETQTFEDGNLIGRFVKREKHEGIIPHILKGLLDERAAVKKSMKSYDKESVEYLMADATQNAIKILLNSHYGYSGDKRAKIFSWEVASSVTSNGRKTIINTSKQIEEDIAVVKYKGVYYRLKVVASDTDSCYIKVDVNYNFGVNDDFEVSKEVVMYCADYVIEKVNEKLEKPMKLAFENYIKRILVVAKKRYSMLTEEDNGDLRIINKGIEVVRRDWTNMTSDMLTLIIDKLLKEKDINKGIKESIEIVKNEIKMLKNDEIDLDKLILTNKLTKPITSYDNKEPHVSVAIKMAERGKRSEVGTRIEYIIIDNGEKLVSKQAEEADYVKEKGLKIDYEYYINKQILNPVMRIFGVLGIRSEVLNVALDDKQQTLDW